MIILVTGWFDEYEDGCPTEKKLFGVSHGYCTDTGKNIITDNFDPRYSLDICYFDRDIQEWVLRDDTQRHTR